MYANSLQGWFLLGVAPKHKRNAARRHACRTQWHSTKVELRGLRASKGIWKRETQGEMVAMVGRDKVS
jgi:phosphodiesterase/alkaline phosphatase D-like protein